MLRSKLMLRSVEFPGYLSWTELGFERVILIVSLQLWSRSKLDMLEIRL